MATKSAPGELELVRLFVNSINIEEESELFDAPEHLGAWLVERGLAPAGIEVTALDLRLAIEVREALRALMAGNAGEETPAEALATLNDAADAARMSLVFRAPDDANFEPEATDVKAAIGRLLSIVHEAMAAGTWQRMKVCLSDTCRWAFYDSARNHSGKWCEMAVCGNRMKARSYRARQVNSPAR